MKIRSNGKVGGSRLGSMLDGNVEPQTAATFKLKLKTSTRCKNNQKTSLVLQPATQRNRNIWRFTNFVRLLFRNLYISSCTSCTGCTSRISPLYVRFSTFYAHDLFTPQLNETYWNFINVLSLTPRSLTVARSAKGRASIIIIIQTIKSTIMKKSFWATKILFR